jgi:hypothetical protein
VPVTKKLFSMAGGRTGVCSESSSTRKGFLRAEEGMAAGMTALGTIETLRAQIFLHEPVREIDEKK